MTTTPPPAPRATGALRDAALTLGLAMLSALGLGAAPGHWFLRIEALELRHGGADGATIVMERSAPMGGPFPVQWTAVVEKLQPQETLVARSRVVCSGLGSGTAGAERRERIHAPMRALIVGADCALLAGETYVLTTTWRFSVLGMQKVVIARTEPVRLGGPETPAAR